MENDKTYKHIHCKDVAFKPISIIKYPTHHEVQGFWINVVGKPFAIDTDKIIIKNEDMDMWHELLL